MYDSLQYSRSDDISPLKTARLCTLSCFFHRSRGSPPPIQGIVLRVVLFFCEGEAVASRLEPAVPSRASVATRGCVRD